MSYLKNFIPTVKTVCAKRGEASAEAEVLLPDYYPPVMRIIRTEAVPFIRSKTVYGEKLALEGNVEFRVLYQSESGDLNSFFYKAPFSHTAEIPEMQAEVPSISAAVGFKDVRALSPQKLSLRASVLLSVTAAVSEEKETVSKEAGDASVSALTETETFCKKTAALSKTVRHGGEISLDGHPTMTRIIRYDAVFSNADSKPLGKKTLIKSDLLLRVAYLSPDLKKPAFLEEKTVISQTFDVEIPEEATAVLRPRLSDCRFDLKEDGDGRISSVEYTVETDFSVAVYSEEKREVTTDVFGVTKDLETEKQKVLAEKIIPQKQTVTFEERVDIGRVSEIFDVSATAAATEATFDKENHISEFGGEFIVNILYADADGEVLSADRRLPFSLKRETGKDCAAVRQDVDVAVSSVNCEKGEDLRISIECNLSGAVFISEEREVITAITEKEAAAIDDDSNLVLYYAKKGERLWDIAKKYRTPPEKISEENGIAGEFIEEEKMIFIPRFI